MKTCSGPWLRRYEAPVLLRSNSAFRLFSATRPHGGGRCVVLTPGPGSAFDDLERAFDEIERVHGLFDHPGLPAVAARGASSGIPFLELACEAVADGIEVRRLLARSGRKLPLAAAAGFVRQVQLALRAAHAAADPRTGRPVCLGRISCANLLFSASGRPFLVGFGHNFPLDSACGQPDGSLTTFEAPEVAAGADPSPSADHVSFLLLLRSLLHLVDLGDALRSGGAAKSAALLEHLRWADMHLLGLPAGSTPAEVEELEVRIRSICGAEPDPGQFAEHIRALLAGRRGPGEMAGGDGLSGLVVGLEASWVAGPDGVRQPLGSALRGIVMALLARHRHAPGSVMTTGELIAAGWPGERPVRGSGANRVYVAVARLRRTVLGDVLERSEGGYRIAPDADVRLAP